jgi:hypothetical protein
MDGHNREWFENRIITIESTEERHQTIMLSTIANRAHQLFEERGSKRGFELDDWLAAEKELWRDEFDGSTSGVRFVVDCPPDPEATTNLRMRARSLVVFRSRTRHTGEANGDLDVEFFHLFSKEIDPAQADVQVRGRSLARLRAREESCSSELVLLPHQESASDLRVVKWRLTGSIER